MDEESMAIGIIGAPPAWGKKCHGPSGISRRGCDFLASYSGNLAIGEKEFLSICKTAGEIAIIFSTGGSP